jgi:1,4-alpha-glucan branching enzyme
LPQLSPETLALLRPGPPQPYAGAYLFAYVSRRARSVTVAGTFNGWIPTANSLQRRALAPSPGAAAVPDSLWYALVPVPRGRHRYKFLVDGSRWIPDPANPDRTSDGSGGVASGLVVR